MTKSSVTSPHYTPERDYFQKTIRTDTGRTCEVRTRDRLMQRLGISAAQLLRIWDA